MNRDAKIGVVVVLIIIGLLVVIWKIKDSGKEVAPVAPPVVENPAPVIPENNTNNIVFPRPTSPGETAIPGEVTSPGMVMPPAAPTEYVVKAGDNLTKIAAAHHVTIDAIRKVNPRLANTDLVRPGDKLKIPAPAAPSSILPAGGVEPAVDPAAVPATRPEPREEPPVVVPPGDRTGPTVPIPDEGVSVPAPEPEAAVIEAPAHAAASGKYVVKAGDTLFKIVREQMGVTDPTKVGAAIDALVKLNNLSDRNAVIKAGQELQLP